MTCRMVAAETGSQSLNGQDIPLGVRQPAVLPEVVIALGL